MGCDLYAGAPAAFAARVSLPAVGPPALATLTRIAAEDLERTVALPEGGGELAPAWVDLFAAVGQAAARRIAKRWLREVDPDASAVPEAIDAAAEMVLSIADLCRGARAAKLPVVSVPTT